MSTITTTGRSTPPLDLSDAASSSPVSWPSVSCRRRHRDPADHRHPTTTYPAVTLHERSSTARLVPGESSPGAADQFAKVEHRLIAAKACCGVANACSRRRSSSRRSARASPAGTSADAADRRSRRSSPLRHPPAAGGQAPRTPGCPNHVTSLQKQQTGGPRTCSPGPRSTWRGPTLRRTTTPVGAHIKSHYSPTTTPTRPTHSSDSHHGLGQADRRPGLGRAENR
jgi:hypothetical protein